MSINHLNKTDKAGRIYCKKLNRVIMVYNAPCDNCEMLLGSMQGQGKECEWEDTGDDEQILVLNPENEYDRVNSRGE